MELLSMDFKRQPFAEKSISEINPEKDIAVCILGRILDITMGSVVIDDGSGKANAYFQNEDAIKNLKAGDIIRLFGFVMPKPEGFDIKGDFFQDMHSLDVEIYNRLMLKKCKDL